MITPFHSFRLGPLLGIALLALSLPGPASAAQPDPSFPATVAFDGDETPAQELVKRGEYRYVFRYFFKLYDVALYTPPATTAEDVLAARSAFRLQFRYLRKIDKDIILESSQRMLEKNLSGEDLSSIADRVEAINEAYRTVRSGDRSSLTFQPGIGTTLAINGEPVTTIEGADFARHYFAIWFGNKPISTSLKEAVLGPAS